jgi:hypothetical protein
LLQVPIAKTAPVLTLALLVLAGAGVRIVDLKLPRAISADERIYTLQANQILKGGILHGNRRTVLAYLRDPALSQYPPPTRSGFLIPLVATMKLTGRTDESAGTYLSCAASILCLTLAAWIGAEFFGAWAAVFGVALLCVFPPELFVANRCWTDALVGLTGFSVFAVTLSILAAERTSGVSRKSSEEKMGTDCSVPATDVLVTKEIMAVDRVVCPHFFFARFLTHPTRFLPLAFLAAAGTFAVLVKETLSIVYAVCLLRALVAIWFGERSRGKAAILLAVAALGGIAALAVSAVFTGGLRSFVDLIIAAGRQLSSNTYALQWQSGPRHQLFSALETFSPFTTAMAIFGTLIAWLPSSGWADRKRRAAAELGVAAWGLMVLYLFIPHSLNLRYVSPVFAPLCLLGGKALSQILSIAKQRLRPWLFWPLGSASIAVLLASVVSDDLRFQRYLAAGLTDLAAPLILAFSAQMDAIGR